MRRLKQYFKVINGSVRNRAKCAKYINKYEARPLDHHYHSPAIDSAALRHKLSKKCCVKTARATKEEKDKSYLFYIINFANNYSAYYLKNLPAAHVLQKAHHHLSCVAFRFAMFRMFIQTLKVIEWKKVGNSLSLVQTLSGGDRLYEY